MCSGGPVACGRSARDVGGATRVTNTGTDEDTPSGSSVGGAMAKLAAAPEEGGMAANAGTAASQQGALESSTPKALSGMECWQQHEWCVVCWLRHSSSVSCTPAPIMKRATIMAVRERSTVTPPA